MSDQPNKSDKNQQSWLPQILLDGLSKAMNKTLSYDHASVEKLEAFDNKSVQVILDSTPFEFFITIKDKALHLSSWSEQQADTVIKGSPLSLFAMNADEPIQGLKSVEIHGDANTGQFFSKWMKNIKPDWEAAWSELLGDGMGVRVSKMVNGVVDFGQRFKSSMIRNTNEYLVEESRDLIAPVEMEDFLDDVDDIKADTERLAHQINQLKANIK